MVADRESDIFEAFALRPAEVDLVVRAAQDRSLDDGGQLFATFDGLPEAGWAELDLPGKPGRTARQARLVARFMVADLAQPGAGVRQDLPPAVRMTAIDVRELDAPSVEAAVRWRLLTTHAAEAWQVIQVHANRPAGAAFVVRDQADRYPVGIRMLSKRLCSAPKYLIYWSERRDLNPRPPVPQTDALPGCATLRPAVRLCRMPSSDAPAPQCRAAPQAACVAAP